MTTAEELDNRQEERESAKVQERESLPETGEDTLELIEGEDRALEEAADRETADVNELGGDATEARQELQQGLEAEEKQTKKSLEMTQEAMRLAEQAETEGGAELSAHAAELMRQALDVSLEDLKPEGVSDEWEGLSTGHEGETVEQEITRQEKEARQTVSERLSDNHDKALDRYTEIRSELSDGGVDIDAIGSILSESDRASEKLSDYDDETLEKFAQYLRFKSTAHETDGKIDVFVADEAQKEMKTIEKEDRDSGMEVDEDGESALARFVDIERQIAVADEHLENLKQEIDSTDDGPGKDALTKESDELQDHLQTLEDQGSVIIEKAIDMDQEQDFMDRVGRYKESRDALEKTLTDIERVGTLERDTSAQADLLDEIMLERDRTEDVDVSEFREEEGDRMDSDEGEESAADAARLTATEAANAPKIKKKKPGFGDISESLKAVGGQKKKRKTFGETLKESIGDTWKDAKDIAKSIWSSMPFGK